VSHRRRGLAIVAVVVSLGYALLLTAIAGRRDPVAGRRVVAFLVEASSAFTAIVAGVRATREELLVAVGLSLLLATPFLLGGLWFFTVFAVCVFAVVAGWQQLTRAATLDRLEWNLRRLPGSELTRYSIAFGVVGVALLLSVPLTRWLGTTVFLAISWVVWPAIVCVVAPRNPLLFGALVNVGTVLPVLAPDSSDVFWWRDPASWIFFGALFLVAAGTSFIVSVPIHLQRRRNALPER
jgi:hypothetical protein